MDEYTRTTYVARMVWLCLFLVGVAFEFITLPKGHRDTLSDAIWDNIRWTNWRFVFFPFWSWLTWHFVLRTKQTIDYRDGIAILIGVVWAFLDYHFIRKS